MALANNLLQGNQAEWALLRRAPEEDLFGVQIAGGKPEAMVRCGEVVSREIDCDFIDVNLGCPLDMLFNKGAGSGLMDAPGRLQRVLEGLNQVTELPVTCKFRTGIKDKVNLAHKLVPKFESWGMSMGTVSKATFCISADF